MADPLSITASVIAVVGAVDSVNKTLVRIKNLVNAPRNLLALMNEVSDLALVLNDVESFVRQTAERRQSHEDKLRHMELLINRAKNRLLELEHLIHYRLLKPDSTPNKIRLSRREWVAAKNIIEDFRRSLRDMRIDIVTQMLILNSQVAPS